jgi:DNA-binding NtrC family response regulator
MAYQGSVFIVANEVAPRQSLQRVLPSLYTISTPADGQEALQDFRDRETDLEMLDLKMPALAAMDVLGEIQETGMDIDVIIINRKVKDLELTEEEEIEKKVLH